jgi:DHA1 family bicyclomycin/chloramphenicol resistance-like MFS transporter
MRRLSHASLLGFIAINFVWLVAQVLGPQPMPFPLFMVFFSLAMEPLGHVAGTASSVLGFMGTVGGSLIGAAIGQAYDGTALPMVAGYFTVSVIGLVFVLIGERGVLFRQQNPRV